MSKMRKRKSGFSLVEVVIALSVIMIVSISAISIAMSSVSSKISAVNKTEAQNFADSVWECFKVAENHGEFESCVRFAENVTLPEAQESDGYRIYTYNSEKNKFVAVIKVAFSETDSSKLDVNVTNKDGEGLIAFSYTKE